MAHELDRVLRAFARRPWAIEPARGEEILAALMLRHANGPRAGPFRDEPAPEGMSTEREGQVAVMNLMGSIVPRASAVRDVSAAFASMERFQAAFRQVANDPGVSAIVLNIDSPGGMVDLVPETASLIAGARRSDRPIYAIANTMAASAAYYIGVSADRLYVSPSGMVGSIGVRMMHVDQSRAVEAQGIRVTELSAGPRKTEGTPFAPLDKAARAALQDEIDVAYAQFVDHVAAMRGVPASVVRADPERAERHMGGGRVYRAERAVELGMADAVATFDEVLAEAASGRRAPRRRRDAEVERRRLALL